MLNQMIMPLRSTCKILFTRTDGNDTNCQFCEQDSGYFWNLL